MDIRQLTYFVEVARHRSFTRASQALYVSQPSISRAIKSLEDELGATLLDRSERDVQLTDIGELVNERALEILCSVRELEQFVEEAVAGVPSKPASPARLPDGRAASVAAVPARRVRASAPLRSVSASSPNQKEAGGTNHEPSDT
ncbi:LysR family transcriptional regulator [Saccharibacillus sp. CPCC 101409]|nr:LysR family transcriptional regulator [Saccharibacillus sp. CPCC 101409]MDO3408948.1 LysR family transcriptional regulator [Saccharibacillus sp. CPCC 101409]